jgi:hypothetical protein
MTNALGQPKMKPTQVGVVEGDEIPVADWVR